MTVTVGQNSDSNLSCLWAKVHQIFEKNVRGIS